MIPSASQKHLFYSEMAKLLEAGFGIRQAADVVSGSHLPKSQQCMLEGLAGGLADGKSITDSLVQDSEAFSDFERSLIRAGERGGSLASAMQHLADYFEMLASARLEILKGLVHPALVLHLGVFIGTVPTAMVTGDETAGEMAGAFFLNLLVAYAMLLVTFFGIRALRRKARTGVRSDRLLRRIPLLGKTRTDIAMAAFSKSYHTCLLAGIPMAETMRMASGSSQSGMILAAGGRLEKSVSEGNPIGPDMLAEPAFPKAFARSYSTGELAGTLDKDLEKWAWHFQNEARSGIKTLAAVIPRILYFIILLFVAWKIVEFYNSYYGGLLDQLQ